MSDVNRVGVRIGKPSTPGSVGRLFPLTSAQTPTNLTALRITGTPNFGFVPNIVDSNEIRSDRQRNKPKLGPYLEVIAQFIKDALSDTAIKTLIDGEEKNVTVSMGIATAYPHKKDSSPHELIARADNALYKQKKSGRDGWTSDQ